VTRINVGVDPGELCDQHLLAEYRELPRLWDFEAKGTPPPHFKLGTGHVLWCAQWQGFLADRYLALVEEMRQRGFAVRYPDPPPWARGGRWPPPGEVHRARPILQARLAERMAGMRRVPTWRGKPRRGVYHDEGSVFLQEIEKT
jgi:hypothetical protein